MIIILKSGRHIDFNNGLIGINGDGEISSGYDDMIYADYHRSLDTDEIFGGALTFDEKMELARYAVGLWYKFVRKEIEENEAKRSQATG